MTLLFFTANFSFGNSETFIENEISILAENFDKVLLIPMRGSGERRSFSKNAEVLDLSGFLPKANNHLSFYLKDFIAESFTLIAKVINGKIIFSQCR